MKNTLLFRKSNALLFWSLALLFLLNTQESWGQTTLNTTAAATGSINNFSSVYNETFTGFTGTTTTLTSAIPNWDVAGSGSSMAMRGSAITTGTSGGWYGSGNIGMLGSSNATNGNATLRLRNLTTSTITSFRVVYTGQRFQTGATSKTVTATWSNSSSATLPTYGNLANSINSYSDATTNISSGVVFGNTISGVTIANNDYIYLRWIHPGGGSSPVLGWDDVYFIPTPITQASSIVFSNIANNSMTVGWTNGNGRRRAVFMREASAGTIANPTDGTKYTASANWSSKGTQLASSGYYCIFDGTTNTVNLTNLVAGTSYYIYVYEYNSDATPTAATISYLTSSTVTNNQQTSAPAPTVTTTSPATNITTGGATLTGVVNANNFATTASFDYGISTSPYTNIAVTATTPASGAVSGSLNTNTALSVTGLTANTLYNFKANASGGSGGSSSGSNVTFYTLANTPSAPIVTNPTNTTLDVAIGTGDNNPPATTYAIQETQQTANLYVQSDGSLGSTAVFQTAATWGTKTVGILNSSLQYTFQVKARNGAVIPVETSFGTSASGTTLIPSAPTANLSAATALTEANLNGASFTITLLNTTFNTVGTLSNASFTLNNAPAGVSISSVVSTSTTSATVTLAFNGTDFDANVSNFNITIAAAEHSSAADLTSSSLLITAYIETINITGDPVTLTAFPGTTINTQGSTERTYTISASQLTSNLVITAPSNFLVSKTTATGFGSSISFTPDASGTVSSSSVFVRYAPTALGSSGNLTISNSSSNVTTKNVTVTGTGIGSTTSTVSLTSGYAYTDNISYKDYQAASGLVADATISTTGASVGVMGLTLNDLGVDGLSTTLSAISFTIPASSGNAIRTAALFSGSTNLGEVAVANSATSIVFSSLNSNIVATDNSTAVFELRVTFKTAVTDNQQLSFTVSSVTALNTGSAFAAANGGAAASSTSNANKIAVIASKLVFTTSPPAAASVGVNLSPVPVVTARDANDNTDLDYAYPGLVVSNTASLANNGTAPTIGSGTGLLTFNNFQFSATGTTKLKVDTSTFTVQSGDIVVTLANAGIVAWSTPTGSAWITTTNWSPTGAPTSIQLGQFNANPTPGSTVGINMNSASTNNGSNAQIVGAIEVSSSRLLPLIIGNSSNISGTLTLAGVVVNQTENVILRNNSSSLLTIQNNGGGTGLNTIALGNATENVVITDGSGGITISSIISGSGRSLKKTGAGTLTLSAASGNNTANTYSGTTTISAGTINVTGLTNITSTALGATTQSVTFSSATPASGTYKLLPGSLTVNTQSFSSSPATPTKIVTFNYSNSTVTVADISLNPVTLSSALANTYGTASTPGVGFIASGTLSPGATITATPNPGYEVSITDATTGFQSTAINNIANGTTVYVRNSATKGAGTTNGAVAVVLSSTGANSVNVTTSGSGNTVSTITVTITPTSGQSKTYGAANPTYTYAFSPTPDVSFTGALGRAAGENVATYAYTLNTLSAGGNYSLVLGGSNTFAITPAALTIAATNQTKCEGEAFTFNGGTMFTTDPVTLPNSETVDSVTLTSTGASSGAVAGSYVITPSTATGGSFTASNYTISYLTTGILTVKPSPIVTASNVSGCSGTPITLLGSGTPVGGSGIYSPTSPYTGTSSTTYTYTYTAPNGCTADATANITITSQPVWYLDADNDGYSSNAAPTSIPAPSVTSCTRPVGGYKLASELHAGGVGSVGTDCLDSNQYANPGQSEICYDGIDNNCDGSLVNGCPNITTTFWTSVCGQTLPALNTSIRPYYSFVGSLPSGVSVTGYRFMITNLTSSQSRVVETVNSLFRITDTNIASYGTNYSIKVSIKLNEEWQDYNTESCTVTTPSIPSATVLNCGTLAAINSPIYTTNVTNARNYRYVITLMGGENNDVPTIYTQSFTRPGNFVRLTELTTVPIRYNAVYKVEISAESLLNGEYTFSSPGTCYMTSPFEPTLQYTSCLGGGLAPDSMTAPLYVTPFAGAPRYRYILENELLGYSQQIDNTTLRFVRLSQFNTLATLIPGEAYRIRIFVELYGVYYEGKSCEVTIPGGPPPVVTKTVEPFKATAYPNPFANNFMLDVKTSSQSVVSLKVYDMIGRLIEQREATVSDLETTTIGDRYPSGVYNVVVSQEDNVQTVRVVKR